ncbi:MAG: hypothetical protein K6G85_07635 [Eubacterium sp.]|nr:hypothetical protein [Eubacterium sp.]
MVETRTTYATDICVGNKNCTGATAPVAKVIIDAVEEAMEAAERGIREAEYAEDIEAAKELEKDYIECADFLKSHEMKE